LVVRGWRVPSQADGHAGQRDVGEEEVEQEQEEQEEQQYR
jgi:hypothetical protein